MEQKVKFIIIGLIIILVISILLNLQIYNTKQALERERDKLNSDKALLQKEVDDKAQNIRRLEERVSLVSQELDTVSKEKDAIQSQFDLVNKAKNELVEQLEALKAKEKTLPSEPSLGQPQALPQVDDAYWAGILKAKTDLELQLENIRNELKTTQINNEQLQRERNTLELDAKNLNREKEDLKRQIEYNQKIMDSIAQEVVREKNDKFKIQESLSSIKNDNGILRRQLKSLISRKINLERRLQELKEANSGLQRRFTEMDTVLRDKVAKIGELKQQIDVVSSGAQVETPQQKEEAVELPPIVVRPQAETPAQESVSYLGRIIGVNKDNNFVIVDLGEEGGVKVGDTFQVYREGQDTAAATIEVIQVRKSISACDIRKESAPIKVGDTIR